MRVKIKHFVGMLGVGMLSLWGGCVVALTRGPEIPVGPEWNPAPPEDWDPERYPDFSEEHLLVWKGQDIGEREVADADPDQPYRVKVRQYLYDETVSQIWVDLDRDWLWDIKAHYRDGKLYIRHDEIDTERYGPQLEWTGAGWILDANWEAPSAEGSSMQLSPGVYAALDWADRPMAGAVVDVAPSEPWKLDVFPDSRGRAERADLDLTRDGHIDQTWTYGTEIHVDMHPDKNTTMHYRWNGERLVFRTTE